MAVDFKDVQVQVVDRRLAMEAVSIDGKRVGYARQEGEIWKGWLDWPHDLEAPDCTGNSRSNLGSAFVALIGSRRV